MLSNNIHYFNDKIYIFLTQNKKGDSSARMNAAATSPISRVRGIKTWMIFTLIGVMKLDIVNQKRIEYSKKEANQASLFNFRMNRLFDSPCKKTLFRVFFLFADNFEKMKLI